MTNDIIIILNYWLIGVCGGRRNPYYGIFGREMFPLASTYILIEYIPYIYTHIHCCSVHTCIHTYM